jgi:hypothetical protein
VKEPSVSIEVSIKLVDPSHFEFSTPYGVPEETGDGDTAHVRVVEGSSSVIGPGLSVPFSTSS